MQLLARTHWWSPMIIGLLVLTGCRTYGGGTDDQVAEALIVITQQLEAEVSGIEIESDMLAEASVLNPELIPYTERMKSISSEYVEMIKKQKKIIKEATSVEDNFLTNWVGRDRYRELHRTLGAIISERELKQIKRQLLYQDMREHIEDVSAGMQASEEGRLQIRPHYYNRPQIAVDFRNLLADIDVEPTD